MCHTRSLCLVMSGPAIFLLACICVDPLLAQDQSTKTPVERAASSKEREAEAANDHQAEPKSRETLEDFELPLLSPVKYPELTIGKVMVPMRDGVGLRTHVYRPCPSV